jgi:hypothetical protein
MQDGGPTTQDPLKPSKTLQTSYNTITQILTSIIHLATFFEKSDSNLASHYFKSFIF